MLNRILTIHDFLSRQLCCKLIYLEHAISGVCSLSFGICFAFLTLTAANAEDFNEVYIYSERSLKQAIT